MTRHQGAPDVAPTPPPSPNHVATTCSQRWRPPHAGPRLPSPCNPPRHWGCLCLELLKPGGQRQALLQKEGPCLTPRAHSTSCTNQRPSTQDPGRKSASSLRTHTPLRKKNDARTCTVCSRQRRTLTQSVPIYLQLWASDGSRPRLQAAPPSHPFVPPALP